MGGSGGGESGGGRVGGEGGGVWGGGGGRKVMEVIRKRGVKRSRRWAWEGGRVGKEMKKW